jgi:cytochrome c biogenesis protein CcmG/thiol:disulfide interchange protein DsbE
MANDNEFVGKRLDALNEPEGFEPNAGRAKIRLQGRTAPRSRRWVWAAVPVTAALLVTLALPAARAVAGMNAPPAGLEHLHYMVLYHWQALVSFVHGPSRAPDFALTDSTGKSVQLSDYRGKVVLLNFWATWCEPCKAEVPWFVDLQKRYAGDLVVLGVSFDEDGWKSVRPFIEARGVNYPVMLAGPELPEKYRKIESLPATLMINRDGRIAGTHLGLASKAKYEALIREQL